MPADRRGRRVPAAASPFAAEPGGVRPPTARPAAGRLVTARLAAARLVTARLAAVRLVTARLAAARLFAAGLVVVAGLVLAGCTSDHPAGPAPSASLSAPAAVALPDCDAVRARLTGGALGQPRSRFAGSTPADPGPGDTRLCPLTGLASDGRTPLQVQVWLLRAAPGVDAGAVLGTAARRQTDGYCGSGTSVTSGTPVTASRCDAGTVQGVVAGQVLVRGRALVGVRVDAASGTDRAMLRDQARRIAEAVATAL